MTPRIFLRVFLAIAFCLTILGGSTAEAQTVQHLLDEGYVDLEKSTPMWFGNAHDRFFEALKQTLSTSDREGEAKARLALGRLRLRAADGMSAIAYFELARDLYEELGDRRGKAEAEYALGEAYVALGMLEPAGGAIERALALDSSTEGRAIGIEADARMAVARTYTAKGAYDEAIRHLLTAFESLHEADDPRRLRQVGLALGDLYHRVGRYREALEVFGQADEALEADETAVDGEAIRAFFQDLHDATSMLLLEMLNPEILLELLEMWLSNKPPPTLALDPAFAARRITVSRRLPFGVGPQQESPLTPRIRMRVVTSYRILDPLVRDCGQLYESHSNDVDFTRNRLREEIPGLDKYQRCYGWINDSAEMTREERRAAAKKYADEYGDEYESCSYASAMPPMMGVGHVGFWDLEPEWPPDCGEQKWASEDGERVKAVFKPLKMSKYLEELDPEEEQWAEQEESMEKRFPELKTQSLDEVIAEKEAALGDVNLSFKGGFFKNLKKTLVDQFKGPLDLISLKQYRMMLKIREEGILSEWHEKWLYLRLSGGSFFLDSIREVQEKHAATIQGMCRQAFETELRDSLSLTLGELGEDFADQSQGADNLAWEAQAPLWDGMSYIGFRPDSFSSLRETLTPSLVFGDCTEKGGVTVNLRRIALWRGRVSLEKGEFSLAVAFFHGAWKGGLGMPRKNEPELEIEALIGLGEAYERQEMPALAAIYYQEALGLVESIQGTLRQESMTMSFADAQTELYGRMVDLLVEMGEEEFTFEYAGRARARAFLDLIGNERLDLRGVPPELSDEWNAARSELADLQVQERELDPFSSGGSQRWELKKRQREVEARLENLQDRVRRRHPSAAAWISVEPAPIENLSQVSVEPDTSLVVYFLSPKRVLAWIIESGTSELVILEAPREKIAAQVEEVRRRIASRETPTELLEQLYTTLFSPLAQKLDHNRLIVVPYGELHQLPFTALRDPGTGRYLVEDYQITLLPSESVVSYVQKRRNPWRNRLLAIGNPDGSLPQAEREAWEVAGLYGAESLTGASADESAVRQAAGQVDVLHFATHGLFQQERPLFGYMSLASSGSQDPKNDGRLEVFEVLNEIDLADSNLVVLSACNSSVGLRNRGDDIISMPRAMLYAGAPAVVSTLWSIDDAASARLMVAFHQQLQQESAGVAEALSAAQVELLKESATASPYFWAGFTLTGDHVSRGAPPQPGPGKDNPWTYDPNAVPPPVPPPIVAVRPAVLPWTKEARSATPAAELAAEAAALLDERWAFGGALAYPKLLEALEAARQGDDRRAEAAARVGLGRLRARAGDIAGGLAHLEMAEQIYFDLEDVLGMATTQEALGEAWGAWGELRWSRKAFADTLELRATEGLDQSEQAADTHETLAWVHELDGAYGTALRHLEEARELWRGLGRKDRAFEAGVSAGELVASLSREDRSVEILEEALGEMDAAAPPTLDPATTAGLLADLAGLSRDQTTRMESWLAHAWFDDPFADWPDPPTVADPVFTQRRRDHLTHLPDMLADLGEAPRLITPIHKEFSLSPRVFMNLIRDCAGLHESYADQRREVGEALGGDTFRADWPVECGPGRERFDPRYVWHTDEGLAPDAEDRRRGLSVWRSERQRLGDMGEATNDRSRRDADRVRERIQTLSASLRPLAWTQGQVDEDPSVLLADKKIVYHLLGSTSAPLPQRILANRSRYIEALDQLCLRNAQVRAHNALWRSYARLGPESAGEAERSREAAWRAAEPLWHTWVELGWVSGGWESVRDLGLPAPTLGTCGNTSQGNASLGSASRGFMDPHEMLLWRGHSSLARGESTLARVWYSQATGDAHGWLKPRTGIRISALAGLARTHAEGDMLALAAIYYRRAIALTESVAEGLRRAELMTSAIDVGSLYEQLDEVLTRMGEGTLSFRVDLRDGACPDWLGDPPEQGTVPEEMSLQREALCRDLIAVQNRETALRANPFTVGGYQGPGNSRTRLLAQRVWLENALHAIDSDIHWPPGETGNEEGLGESESVAESVEGEAVNAMRDGFGRSRPGFGLIDKFMEKVLLKAVKKVKGVLKKGAKWAKKKVRRKKEDEVSTKHLPSPEEVWGVTLYDNKDFEGNHQSFDQDIPSLKGQPLGHDYASSVQVDPGCIVVLYELKDYQGAATELRVDTPTLKGTRVGNDEVTSLRVRCR